MCELLGFEFWALSLDPHFCSFSVVILQIGSHFLPKLAWDGTCVWSLPPPWDFFFGLVWPGAKILPISASHIVWMTGACNNIQLLFEMRFCELCPYWPETQTLPISGSQVARISGITISTQLNLYIHITESAHEI
jgi:hypothetical protein